MSAGGRSGTRTGAVADPGLPQDVPTLKVTAPTLQSPDDGATLEEPVQSLRVAAPQATHVEEPVEADIRIEIWTVPLGAAPVHTVLIPGGAATTSHSTPENLLQDETTYVWRARGELDGAVGPWSEPFGFTTQFVKIDPPRPTDPINGKVTNSVRPVFLLSLEVQVAFMRGTASVFVSPIIRVRAGCRNW